MNTLILDVETKISNKGNPFDLTNKCVVVGMKWSDNLPFDIYWNEEERPDNVNFFQNKLDAANLIVGFNIKFDLHWLRKIGINISKIKVWDCQLAEFLLSNQTMKYPSLDEVAALYGLGSKIDTVKLEFWDKGIDTDAIPKDILSKYLTQDLVLTQQIYEKQLERFLGDSKGLYSLFKLQCLDLLVLQNIEENGIKFNTEKALLKAKEVEVELRTIEQTLATTLEEIWHTKIK